MNAEQIAARIKSREKLDIVWFALICIADLVLHMVFDIHILIILLSNIPPIIIFGIFDLNTVLIKQDIIYKYGDPVLYKRVHDLTKKTEPFNDEANTIAEITAYYYLGDYERVIYIMENDSKLLRPQQHLLMSYYIQSQFFKGDLNGIIKGREVLEKYKNKRFTQSAKIIMTHTYLISDFTYYYLIKDFENAYKACKKFTNPPKNMPVYKIYTDFYTALCEKAIGNLHLAQELFIQVANQNNSLAIVEEAKKNLMN
ncbi:MAG: hypothetical protein CVU97_03355 [Firmicutes bacterium HGW-Firmicutes-21]|nr:MAG: hypothetical protein CVU97_03355 [Firmicutes bacterium HGW-Firmicutes-21]